MVRPTTIEIKKDVTMDELDKRIRSLKKNVRVLKRLYFVKYRYQGLLRNLQKWWMLPKR